MCMKERINVLSTEMDCITAKEAMLKAIAFLERESVDIIEVLSMSALMLSLIHISEPTRH